MKGRELVYVDPEDFFLVEPFLAVSNSQNFDPTTILLHWTSSPTIGGSIDKIQDHNSKNRYTINYHFIIDYDGKIYQTAPIGKRVNHAGRSWGPEGKDLNKYSYAISFPITNETIKSGGTPEQQESLKKLCLELIEYNPKIKYITGHNSVRPVERADFYSWNFEKTAKEINNILGPNTIKYWDGTKKFPENSKDAGYPNDPYFVRKNIISTHEQYKLFAKNNQFIADTNNNIV